LQAISADHEVACRNWAQVQPLAYDDGVAVVRQLKDGAEPLLEASALSLRYGHKSLWSRLFPASQLPMVVRDVSFSIAQGEVVALVGESGSGKSTIARAISGLLPAAAGEVRYRENVLNGDIDARSQDVVRRIQFIFQNPDASLNPRQSVGRALARPIEVFFQGADIAKGELVDKALEEVMLSSDYRRRYPDQLSGGERQRVAIARALVAQPDLLLCDEILSALDVSVQANVLDLLERLRGGTSVAMLFISHDLAVVRRLADRVCVLYHGQMMETGPTETVFSPPFHPYTMTLLRSVPGSEFRAGRLPVPADDSRVPEPQGCAFAGRCPWQPDDRCFTERPPEHRNDDGSSIQCHLPTSRLEALDDPSDTPRKSEPA
jgi:peptide/nickel transport system ATP-binding protein